MGSLRGDFGKIIRQLCRQKEVELIEGHHVHLVLSVPPKYSISMVVGYLKGKSAIHTTAKFMASRKVLSANIFGHVDTASAHLD